MRVEVVFPWRAGCRHREAALAYVASRWGLSWPRVTQVLGVCPEGPWIKAEALREATERTEADVVVVSDADVWCDGIGEAIEQATHHGWAIPHGDVYRLTPEATADILDAGHPPDLHPRNIQQRYRGYEGGGIVILTTEALAAAPPDPRFVGWGQEDEAWAIALRTMVGPPWRGDAPLIHLWHPPQPRRSRAIGSIHNLELLRRYVGAADDRPTMGALIEEARCSTQC